MTGIDLTRRRLLGGIGVAGVATAVGVVPAAGVASSAGTEAAAADVAPLVGLALGAIDFQPITGPVSYEYVPPGGVRVTSGQAFFVAGLRLPAGVNLVGITAYIAPNGSVHNMDLVRYDPLQLTYETIASGLSTAGVGSAPESVHFTGLPHVVEDGWNYRLDNMLLGAGGVVLYGAEVRYTVPPDPPADDAGRFVPYVGTSPRVYDSRTASRLAADEERVVALGLPGSAQAAVFNLTVTETGGPGGYVACFPAGTAWPGSSSINWSAPGLDVANLVICRTDTSGQVVLRAGGASTHVLVDVVGHYA